MTQQLQYQDIYNISSQYGISTTQQKLMNHFGPSLHPKISYMISKDVDELNCSITQNIIDIWHQSGAKTWQQFINNSSLQNISKYNPNTFMALQIYQTEFTQNIYSPLLPYTSAIRKYVFEGKANKLLHQIHQIYNYLKQIKIKNSNHILQIDVRSFHNYMDVEPDSEELDEWYYTDMDDMESELKNNCNIQSNSYESNLGKILKQCVMNDDKCNYKRFELLINDTEIELNEAKTNNTVPDIKSIKNAPLCMLFNSISEYKHNMGLINISFQVSRDNIAAYIYISDENGKLFGQRIFNTDLMTLIPLLFNDKTIDEYIQYKLKHFEFIPDPIYNKFYKFILNINNHKMNRRQLIFLTDIEDFVNGLNEGKISNIIDVSIIKQCLIKHNINYDYFMNKNHKRTDFIQLLQPYNIKKGIICKIWNEFHNKNIAAPNAMEYNENFIAQNAMEHQQYMENQHENNMQKIALLQQQLKNEREKNHNLNRVLNVAMNDMESADALNNEMRYLNLMTFNNMYAHMIEQVSFVLWVLYWYILYRKLYFIFR